MSEVIQSKRFFPYGCQSVNQDDIEAVCAVLAGDWITRGPKVAELESCVAEYCGASYAVAFSSGTAALQASFHVLDLGPYDRIVSTPNSYIATVIGCQRGAKLQFTDIDRDSGNMSLASLQQIMNVPMSRGRSVITPVHFAGIPVDMRQLESCITEPDAVVVEDASHAFGARYADGTMVGCCRYSQLTVFSLHPLKNFTSAEGGLITTNDAELYRRLRLFRNNEMEKDPDYLEGDSVGPWYYECQGLTGNFHMSDLHAALGLSQLGRVDGFVEKRRQLLKAYRKFLNELPGVRLFSEEHDERAAYHLCLLQIDFPRFATDRVRLMQALKEEGVGTQVLYIPLYKHPVIRKGSTVNWEEQCPEMEAYYAQALALPLYVDLTLEDVEQICQILKRTLAISE